MITLGAGADIVRLAAKGEVAGAAGVNVMHITDFVAGTDVIQLRADGATASQVLQGLTLIAATTTVGAMATALSSTTAVNSLADVYAQLGTVLTAANFVASTAAADGVVAQVVDLTTGSAAGKYLVINDSAAGFAAADDIVINITGVSGTISATDFTFAA